MPRIERDPRTLRIELQLMYTLRVCKYQNPEAPLSPVEKRRIKKTARDVIRELNKNAKTTKPNQ